jgi:CRISPR-associated protein Cas2
MIIISYDIKDDKLRTSFSKMLTRHGAIRLQFSVYEVNNTKRILDNIQIQIKEKYGKFFTPDDSVVIFEVSNSSVLKFGNAIHRDKDVFFF